jgi:hypothetical protein
MHYLRFLSGALPVAAGSLFFFACSSDVGDDEPKKNETLERGKIICTERCEKEMDAGCDSTPDNYLSGCVALCSDKYRYFGACEAELTALDRCRIDRGTFSCDGSGFPMIGPVGVCGDEGDSCTDCTGSNLLSCL